MRVMSEPFTFNPKLDFGYAIVPGGLYLSTSVISLTPACDVKYAYAHSVSTTMRLRNPTRYMMCTNSQNTHANHPEN